MKYLIALYIALGLVLSLIVGIQYNCDGQEMFPLYYGNPFIFKEKSLGSSMTYFFSVSGIVLNTLVWSVVVLLIRQGFRYLIKKSGGNRIFRGAYKTVIVLLIAFTTLNIVIEYQMMGIGFEEGRNYWYMDLNNEAEKWGMECEGEITLMRR